MKTTHTLLSLVFLLLMFSDGLSQTDKIIADLESEVSLMVENMPKRKRAKFPTNLDSLLAMRDLTSLKRTLDTTTADYVFVNEEFLLDGSAYRLTHKYFFLADSSDTDYCGTLLPVRTRYRIRGYIDTLEERDFNVYETWGEVSTVFKFKMRPSLRNLFRPVKSDPFFESLKALDGKRIKGSLDYLIDGSEINSLDMVRDLFKGAKYVSSGAYIINSYGGCIIDRRENIINGLKSSTIVELPFYRIRALIHRPSGKVVMRFEYPKASYPVTYRVNVGFGGRCF